MIDTFAVLAFFGSACRALALAAFALFLIHGASSTVVRSCRWMARTAPLADEDTSAIRRHLLGSRYLLAIERLRRAIPPDGEYLLVRGGTERQGGPLWVRFELAPRRARFLGPWTELPGGRDLRRKLPPGPRWVVIAFSEARPPILMDRQEFLRALDRSHGGL